MFPETYEIILHLIAPALSATNAKGRKQIHPGKQLLITLWFLSTPDSYRYLLIVIMEAFQQEIHKHNVTQLAANHVTLFFCTFLLKSSQYN